MKPAEIVTAVVSIPVVAAFLVSVMATPVELPAPAPTSVEATEALAAVAIDEIIVVAKRPSSNSAS